MGLALYPTKRIYLVLAIASLTAGLAYLFLRFNDYLEANAQGICWAEGRRLAPEELRIRAIKTLILKEKEALDDWNKRSYKQNSYWRVIKRDVDEHELLALRQSYPDFPQDFGERDVEKTIARLFGMDDVNPTWLSSDTFYQAAIENKYMFVDSESPWAMYRTNSYVAYKENELKKLIALDLNFQDALHGFGNYYFFIQKLTPSNEVAKNKYISIFSEYFAINNCGTSIYGTRTEFSKLGPSMDTALRPMGRSEIDSDRSTNTLVYEFLKGL